MGLNGKERFGAEAEAWVGGAERQTSATADKHGSVSEGGGVGGDEGRKKGGQGERRDEAGNEALGSFAKSSSSLRRHGGTKAQTCFSSVKRFCDKTTVKTFHTCTYDVHTFYIVVTLMWLCC